MSTLWDDLSPQARAAAGPWLERFGIRIDATGALIRAADPSRDDGGPWTVPPEPPEPPEEPDPNETPHQRCARSCFRRMERQLRWCAEQGDPGCADAARVALALCLEGCKED